MASQRSSQHRRHQYVRDGDGFIESRQEAEFRLDDRYTRLSNLKASGDACCAVLKSETTGKLVVVKRVRLSAVQRANTDKTDTTSPCPVEAELLLLKLQPHPNIVRVYACEDHPSRPNKPLVYMEYCSGRDLLDQILKFQALGVEIPVIFSLHVLVGMGHALAYLHHGLRINETMDEVRMEENEPIIHGDIKPENIFLRFPGRQECGMPDVVLGDFGCAQLAEESYGVTGTESYESPEVLAVNQLKDEDPQAYLRAISGKIMTIKSDIYQLGLVLKLMASQVLFSSGADPLKMELPSKYDDENGFRAALVWLLQLNPQDRPECTLAAKTGFMHVVDDMRKARDTLFADLGPVESAYWRGASTTSAR
ncbi:kinase-like domain-containing protein [Neohortaea acidophila]|uniref:non-specific serine/threonine protein kinase n=1 Tax=Neohortaea acidophila TaxID=245834 RepID=A0A6A6PXW7_9PEZI|nr:kinase-like domain-containing protein [Neohortaea acidophila]KAF2484559.1 kinase-like domain-containing protein [Neohortaea acidophila]